MIRNGSRSVDRVQDPAVTRLRRRLRDAVRDLPDTKRGKLKPEDVTTLREAGLDELADVAEIYVSK